MKFSVIKYIKKRPYIFFILPGAILYSLLVIYPIFFSFMNSFVKWDGVGEKVFVGVNNFKTLFFSPIYAPQLFNALKNGVIFVILSYVIGIPLAFYFAAMIDRKVLFSKLCQTIIFLPQVISTVAIGLLVLLFLDPTFGVVNVVLNMVGLNSFTRAWLGDTIILKIIVSLISVWKVIGIPMMLILANLKAIPDEYLEAADLDGANEWNKFLFIKLPLLRPSLSNTVIIIFLGSFATFDIPYLLGGATGGPSNSIDTLGTMFYRIAFGSPYLTNTMGLATAIAVLQFVIILIVSITQIMLLRKNETEL